MFLALMLVLSPMVLQTSAEEMTFLTDEQFSYEDIPDGYLEASSQPGTVEKLRYENVNGTVKSVLVYLPYGYAESEDRYNVVYMLHGSSGSPKSYLKTDEATQFQCLLDHMIENGELQPLIVVVSTYYESSEDFTRYMPLTDQVKAASDFPNELVKLIVPAVETEYHTYLEGTDKDGIRQSRMHRAVAGFSLGATVTWYTFIQRMDAFGWFLPISEASWDDGSGGVTGIWDSTLSAQVLYDSVIDQGFTKDDFYLHVATGTEDEAFEVSTEQMISLLEYDLRI